MVTWMSCIIAIIFNIFVNPIALEAIGWKYYIVYIVLLVLYLATIFLAYPETRGFTLEEMASVFDKDGVVETHCAVSVDDETPKEDGQKMKA